MDVHDVDERTLRRELAALGARLAAIPSDRFAERAPLLKQREEVAGDLRAGVAVDPEILTRWANRAGRKETHDGSKPFIPSHGEGGGSEF